MKKQKTLKSKLSFAGIGVHSGRLCCVTLWPAQSGHGIQFYSKHCPQHKLRIGSFVPEQAMHATVIKGEQWAVSTIEHLMASLTMLGVSNVLVEVDGGEIPILDGSALLFVEEILSVGLVEQDGNVCVFRPKEVLRFADDKGRFIELTPWEEPDREDLFVDYQADFTHPLLGRGDLEGFITPEYFIKHIAPARTFGFLEQLPVLRRHNLALGSSLGNTIVIGQELLNDLRFPDECVRHKVLDLIGDLSLIGGWLACSVKACKTSHSFNRFVVEHVIQRPDLWDCTMPQKT